MGVTYYYRRRSTGETVALAAIDAEIGEVLADTWPATARHPSKFPAADSDESLAMTAMFAIGLSAWRSGDWDEARFASALAGFEIPEAVARRFLNGEYVFVCER